MAKSVTSAVISIPAARLSFANIFTPKPFAPGQKPTFSATFILDPANATHAEAIAKIKSEMSRLAAEAFPGEKLGPDRLCLKKGDTKGYDGWKGMIVLTSGNTTRPVVVNRKREPVAEGDKEAPYSGCYVNGTVTLWTQNNSFGKRINCNLRGIQFVKDGQAFGVAPVDAEDEFEALPDDGGQGAAASGDDFDNIPF